MAPKNGGKSNTDRGWSATLLTTQEAASRLRISIPELYRLLRSGKLRGFKIGRRWRIPEDAITEFLEGSIRVRK